MRLFAALLALATALAAQDYGTNYRMKIEVAGETRKGVLFLPKNFKKGEAFPLVVALPDTRGKAYLEIGQFQQPAYDKRFAIFSVDINTSGARGWHPKEQLEMQRDMEAVTTGMKQAFAKAKEQGVALDESAVVLTGHSGGTYLTLWLGLRRPDLFFGVCGRSCVFHVETVQFGKFDKLQPDLAMPIFLYYGEIDDPRVKKETRLAKKTLDAAGFSAVTLRVVPKMKHESKPEVFLEWFYGLLKKTAKGRKESRRIKAEVDKLREAARAGRPAAFSKLVKLVEREEKAGVKGGAGALLAEVEVAAQKHWERAVDLEADGQLIAAAETFRQIMKKYGPLEIGKKARSHRVKLIKSDGYKAEEMLRKAQQYLEKGKKDKAFDILEKLVDRYGETIAAARAQALLQG